MITADAAYSFDSHIVVSTTQDTHLFRLEVASVISRVVPSSAGFILNLPTLALCNVIRGQHDEFGNAASDSSLVVQVTPKDLVLLESDLLGEYIRIESWSPKCLSQQRNQGDIDSQIVAASVNPSQFVLAISGAILVLLKLNENDRFQVTRLVACSRLLSTKTFGLLTSARYQQSLPCGQ
jgi:DNA damage-binding protein 1